MSIIYDKLKEKSTQIFRIRSYYKFMNNERMIEMTEIALWKFLFYVLYKKLRSLFLFGKTITENKWRHSTQLLDMQLCSETGTSTASCKMNKS